MLEALRTLSAKLGSDPLLVQAAGGNTSLKRDGIMWIKASGTWLRDALAKQESVNQRQEERMLQMEMALAEVLRNQSTLAQVSSSN